MYFIFYIFLYISDAIFCTRSCGANGMGTVLFSSSDLHKQCWSPEEIAILTTRMILEDILPDIRILNIDNDEYVNDIVEYFRLLISIIRKMSCGRKKHITMLALTDLLGGYLHHAVLPITRAAYYAGLLDYKSMEKLIQLYEELKFFLRTNGQGWSMPIDTGNEFDVAPIDFRTETPRCNKSCCRNLIYYRHEPSRKRSIDDTRSRCYFFPIPFLDSKVRPNAIAVPFKRYSLRNIESKRAAYLVTKYFIAVEKCFQDLNVDDSTLERFHNNMYTWVEKQVVPKLKDDKFYSAFGGILRVEESLRSLGAKMNQEEPREGEGEEGEEEIGQVPGGETTSRSSMVLLAMLIIIFVWFIIGTLFICYRMRANNLKGKPCKGPKSDGTCSGSTSGSSRWTILSRSSSKKSTDTCKCCSSASDKSLCNCCSTTSHKSTGETTTPSSDHEKRSSKPKQRLKFSSPCVCDGFAVIDTKHSMKVLPSIPEMSENSSMRKSNSKSRRISFDKPLATSSREDMLDNLNLRGNKRRVCVPDLTEVDLAPCNRSEKATSASSSKTKASGRECRPQASGESTDETAVTANSPHIYACHSSLTGNYTTDQRYPLDKPYIFGYDFQTSSSSEVSDDDTEGKTCSTKYRCDDD